MEPQSSTVELVKELKEWCKKEELDEAHALMVLIPRETNNTEIEETLGSIKALGRVRVRGRTLSLKRQHFSVLCECKEKVDPTKVPSELSPSGQEDKWRIVISSESLGEEGDFPETPPSASADTLIRAEGDLLSKMAKPSNENSSYRRLRIFSGTVPTPTGEESYEHWIEHAHLMVDESDCSLKEKRRCIMESLKGPALAVVKAVRAADSDVSPMQCLEAIESAFGSAETGEDLYFAFRLLQQQPQENLSDFLRRLELSLTKVIRHGGLPIERANRARVEQLLRGAVHSDMMLVQLKLRERKGNPPSFLELLSEIRSEEEYESSRAKLNSSVKRVQAQPNADESREDIQKLRAELQELRSMFTSMKSAPSQTLADGKECESLTKRTAAETECESEIAALRKQVKSLQKQLESKKSKVSESPATALRVEHTRQHQVRADSSHLAPLMGTSAIAVVKIITIRLSAVMQTIPPK
ncbi:paraneoplastic antigen Ma2-like [Neoarius graeffei]|uniref:paraneoplastic antigen Ma2-like n=1 Tax=Neoarius graeffei TaxID=443677 RepID=UPI00298C9212|nr:paraneoplastic antigen Ma2-like [Neoarius graeffei]